MEERYIIRALKQYMNAENEYIFYRSNDSTECKFTFKQHEAFFFKKEEVAKELILRFGNKFPVYIVEIVKVFVKVSKNG